MIEDLVYCQHCPFKGTVNEHVKHWCERQGVERCKEKNYYFDEFTGNLHYRCSYILGHKGPHKMVAIA